MSRRQERVNGEWNTPEHGFTWEHVEIEVLMDIRGQLQTLNRLLGCPNFTGIPASLRTIARQTKPPKAK